MDFEKIKCFIVAGPGFAKDSFVKYMDLEASRRNLRSVIENRYRIIEVHASTAFKGAIREVLEAPAVMSQIKDTKAAMEVRALDDFFEMLAAQPERAFYGPAHVFAAHEAGLRVKGSGREVWGLLMRFQGLGFRVKGLGFKVDVLGFRV